MIKVRNLYKRYGSKEVVSGVSTDIKKSSITSIIGPNGAGKSTLLSIIARLTKQDEGEVIIDGKNLEEWDEEQLAKRISILTQSNSINVRLTVRELVSFGRFPHSKGRLNETDKKIIDRSLSYLNLEQLQDRYLDQLSGGQVQRAYIAMVLAQDTDYIFLDEPLNNLDMKHSVEIMQILRRLVDELDKTIVIVIHDINFASKYSDKILALKDGKVVEDGHMEDIIKDKILSKIYDLDFKVRLTDGMRLCMYY